MNGKSYARRAGWPVVAVLGLTAILFVGGTPLAWARGKPLAAPPKLAAPVIDASPLARPGEPPATMVDPNVQQVSCPTCAAGILGDTHGGGIDVGDGGCAGCGDGVGGCGCGGPCCVPGRKCCHGCYADGWCGQCWCRFYDCICCPDPCYEGHWVAAANSAFFVEDARPITQFHLRYDYLHNMDFPDRSEFFWARDGGGGKGPPIAERRLTNNELNFYTEIAAKNIGVSIEMPYRFVQPEFNMSSSGFADLKIATKTLLLDCELMQFSFQFRTFIPTGNPRTGLGTGHVALEPSFLCAAKLMPDCYLQSQVSEWIPLGGDDEYQGSIFHYHFSLNKVLCRLTGDLQVIGTAELNGWYFQTGHYTDPTIINPVDGKLIPQRSGGETYLSAGPGIRFVLCDKMDLGVGAAIGLTHINWYDESVRIEFRYRF